MSANWLSEDMAHALAALCPPLQTADVLNAADTLTAHVAWPHVVVIEHMFGRDVDPVCLRNIIEALHVLYDFQ
ncbi:MAG: hypothetical protein M3336_11480 [Chloroflexota bacterium]|nr:hypothetical protein [Chloroflexota bacterium]